MAKQSLAAALGAVLLGGGAALAEPAAYPSPDAAVGAIVSALEARDRDALVAVFGPEHEDLVLTGDAERDRATWGDFLRAYRAGNRLAVDETGTGAVLFLGADAWPFPARIVRGEDGAWRFDPEGARTEILARRIGENELAVIGLLKSYVAAQGRFRAMDADGDGVMEFASAILSDPGERNGLYWPPEDGAPESPIGPFMARAAASGYSVDGEDEGPEPYLGYTYRVLTGQGPAAPGGAYDYVVNGNMVAGHALLATPATYGETGVMSFMVGESGMVYEADLGEGTLDTAEGIDLFLPSDAWAPIE